MEIEAGKMKLLLEEAKKDAVWVQKMKAAKNADEYIKLYQEKGIEIAPEEKQKLNDLLGNKQGQLLDEELNVITGGYIPIFDECLQRYDRKRCFDGTLFDMFSGCPNCRLVEIKKGYPWNTCILSCAKGYFNNIEGPPTKGELIK